MEKFIQDLKAFVDLEYDTQNESIQEIWRLPLKERVKKGEALDKLTFKREQLSSRKSNLGILTCPINLSKFRKGSRLLLHKGDPFDKNNSYACEIVEDNGNELKIEPGFKVSFSNLENGSGYILDNDMTDVRHLQKEALDSMLSLAKGVELYKILTGNKVNQFDTSKKATGDQLAIELGMNEKQKEAFAQAYATDSHYLIQGPPGTGKTWVLAHLAAQLARDGEKVLITAFTHRAINNALRKIKQTTGFDKVAKIGQKTKSDDLEWEGGAVKNYERLNRSRYTTLGKGFILGGTCFAVCTSRLKAMEFDTVIFDEAGQVPLPLAIAGMLSGKKFIFIGDHLQMSPIVTAVHENQHLTKSIFESLIQTSSNTMLNTTYRMNRKINAFPSSEFYKGALMTDPNNADQKLVYTTAPSNYSDLLSPDLPSVFLNLKHKKRTIRSKEEAIHIVGIIEELIHAGISKEEIAVVAPYRAQGRLIRKKLRERFENEDAAILEKITIDTVERIQGQERDVIIISLTTSDLEHAAQNAAFFFRPNRLNVALTRPRYKRIVVGSSVLFETKTNDPKLNEWIAIFKRFYNSCEIIEH